MNPYWGKDFFEFFSLLFLRLVRAMKGDLAFCDLASDEVQLLVLAGVGISTSLIGNLLILKRMTMLANALSHTILLGLVSAYLFLFPLMGASEEGIGMDLNLLMAAAFFTSLFTVLSTEFLKRVAKVQEDASIGLVFTTLFALGITAVTLFARNLHLEADAVMGNVDALHLHDLKLVGFVALLNAVVMLLFFKEWKITSFDSRLAASLGFCPLLFDLLLLFQTALTLVGAFRAVGVFLVLALLVFPPLAARRLTHNLGRLFFLSPLLGAAASVLAVALSRHLLSVYHLALSTAGLLVFILGCLYLLLLLPSLTFRKKKGIIL